jgi:cell division protein FtsB
MRNAIALGLALTSYNAVFASSVDHMDTHFDTKDTGSSFTGWFLFFITNTMLVAMFAYLKRNSIQALFAPKIQLQEENDALKEEITKLKEKLSNRPQPSHDEIPPSTQSKEELSKVLENNSKLERKVEQLNDDLKALKSKNALLETERSNLKSQLEEKSKTEHPTTSNDREKNLEEKILESESKQKVISDE